MSNIIFPGKSNNLLIHSKGQDITDEIKYNKSDLVLLTPSFQNKFEEVTQHSFIYLKEDKSSVQYLDNNSNIVLLEKKSENLTNNDTSNFELKNETLLFPDDLKQEEHTLITPPESDGLIFPGELQEEKRHTLIYPIVPSYNDDYLKVDNALSEFSTAELKAKARENLGVDDQIEWGEIRGSLDDQTDLKQYLKDVIESSTSEWIDVIY